ncbi:MAG: DUF47 family protein [Chromatiaceae bacterium]|jgi:predicted phosphate transport protein (TIGR00153 family)|nr:DUF47 family protein [Chromatiaceae bacterium]MBP6242721.1 DUF47 family protein [Chromatiaceae bacterium]MBP7983372.1 DUF47 family protein [Chromatiaceae bacterium]MBP8024071.1 DUF47 family protein [Chromatiaceae bacterium]MBP9603517.1 DUF47 family protein [Chromatiaceae bacterium]
MNQNKLALFGKTKAMEAMIDNFLDKISEGGMRFEQGIASYVDGATAERLTDQAAQLRATEGDGHRLRLVIETDLYTEMLIPDFRADVLSLLEDLNYLLGLVEDIFLAITVEEPVIEDAFKADFKVLASAAVKTMESAILGARAFFRNISAVRDHLGKVSFHEEECDQCATRLKRDIFGSDLGLDRKMHLRYFVDKIDNLADEAEDVGDWLAIYSIKRAL